MMTQADTVPHRYGPGKWIAAYLVLLLVLVGAGIWFYYVSYTKIQVERREELGAIGKLKTQWIAEWRKRCLRDAGRLAGTPLFSDVLREFLNHPDDPTLRSRMQRRMEYELKNSNDEALELYSREGWLIFSVGHAGNCPAVGELVSRAVAKCEPVLDTLHKHEAGNIRITAAAPVTDESGRVLAVLAIHMDPAADLFPLVAEWPTESKTAETLLVERSGDDVLVLTKLRHKADAALNLRIPLSRTIAPEAQAVNGLTGQFLGTDYRGVKVLSDVRPVPNSPWFMVSKVDSAEAYADLLGAMDLVLLVFVCVAIAAGATMYGLYRGGQVRLLRDLHEQRAASEENLKSLNAKLEDRVARRTAQLEASNKELEAFAYSVSHDLRAPLRAIKGFATILLEDYSPKLDEEAKRLLGVIRSNTEKMDRLILGILDLSRVARAEIVPVEVDMTSVALSVWEELLPAAEREQYQFILPPLPPVRGDALLLRQVWVNLLSNAAKYSARSRTRRIEVGAVAGAGEISFFVKDSGAGFDPESASKLFGLFQRLHTDADFEGLGIGLATVRHIIHRHGGQVHAEGRPQEGATFSFTLPTQPPRHAS